MSGDQTVIVDYGLGNLFSIKSAFDFLGSPALISSDPSAIAGAERVVLPGVGAFEDGMKGLRQRGLVEPLLEYVSSDAPLLGICLGMQLLFSESEEFGRHAGLGIIPGRVVRFPDPPLSGPNYKIPNTGWCGITPAKSLAWNSTILDGLNDGECMYFVHSYYAVPGDPDHSLAQTSYGIVKYCSVARKGNVYGTQFHPEKSGPMGLNILKNFITLKKKRAAYSL